MSAEQAKALTDALLHLEPARVDVVPLAGAVELSGARAVLHEATLVAVDEAGERLSVLCTALLRGEASAAEVRHQLDALRGLLDLL